MKLFFNRIQNLSQKLKKDYPILGIFNIFNPFAMMRFADKLWHAPVPQELKNFKFVKPSSFLHRQQQLAQTSFANIRNLALKTSAIPKPHSTQYRQYRFEGISGNLLFHYRNKK